MTSEHTCPKCGHIYHKKWRTLKYEPTTIPNVVPTDPSNFIYRFLLLKTIRYHIKRFLRKIVKRHISTIFRDDYVVVTYGFDYVLFRIEENGEAKYITHQEGEGKRGGIQEGIIEKGEWYLGNEKYDSKLEEEINDVLSLFLFQKEWAKARLDSLLKRKQELREKKIQMESKKSIKKTVPIRIPKTPSPSKLPRGEADGFFGMFSDESETPESETVRTYKKPIPIPTTFEIEERRKAEKKRLGKD